MPPLSRRSFLTKSAELTAALAAAGACAPLVSRRASTTSFASQGDEFTLVGDRISATWSVAGDHGLTLRRIAG